MKQSKTIFTHAFTVQKKDLNHHGILFGGKLLAELDVTLANALRQLTDLEFVTGSTDKVRFIQPLQLGEKVTITAIVSGADLRVGEVFGRVYKQNQELAAYAFFTYIVLKKDASLPVLETDSAFGRELNKGFLARQQASTKHHQQLLAMLEQDDTHA